MNIETYLNAMQKVRVGSGWDMDRRMRQRDAFRDRILMKFDAKEMLIQLQHMKISSQRERIAELEAEFNHYQDQYHE